MKEYSSNGLKHLDLIQSYFIALLCEINAAYQPENNNISSQYLTLTNQFKALLYEKIKDKHLVSDYATMLNISPNHLNKVIKSATGKSPSQWIDEVLITEAKILLYQTKLSIKEIAFGVGFTDASYFSRLFKRHTGLTPLQYRKMIEKS